MNTKRVCPEKYTQLFGGEELLAGFCDSSFDAIICHNVLEYVGGSDKRTGILREFVRLLKPGGILSVVKHNRAGRVMQMAVLLDNLEEAEAILGKR